MLKSLFPQAEKSISRTPLPFGWPERVCSRRPICVDLCSPQWTIAPSHRACLTSNATPLYRPWITDCHCGMPVCNTRPERCQYPSTSASRLTRSSCPRWSYCQSARDEVIVVSTSSPSYPRSGMLQNLGLPLTHMPSLSFSPTFAFFSLFVLHYSR